MRHHLRIHLNNYRNGRGTKILAITSVHVYTSNRKQVTKFTTHEEHLVMLMSEIHFELLHIKTARPYQLFLTSVWFLSLFFLCRWLAGNPGNMYFTRLCFPFTIIILEENTYSVIVYDNDVQVNCNHSSLSVFERERYN